MNKAQKVLNLIGPNTPVLLEEQINEAILTNKEFNKLMSLSKTAFKALQEVETELARQMMSNDSRSKKPFDKAFKTVDKTKKECSKMVMGLNF